jgi:low temperature requirement protein LtrA
MTEPHPPHQPRRWRIFSLEGALAAFGLFSLGSGLWQGELMPAFWGVTILTGLVILVAVRRRDWQKHWQELEKPHSDGRDAKKPDLL